MSKTLAIDFDGVIHAYSRGWGDGSIYDVPVPGVLTALDLLAERYRLVVFTARDDLTSVRTWLVEHRLIQFIDEVTNSKPKAWLYLDDRGLRFESWKQALEVIAELDPSDDWQMIT